MAIIHCTIQEFHHFIGPRIRNAINNMTRRHRNERRGICEFCGQHAELQSAHVHGRDRRLLIEEVLCNYKNEDGNISCDVALVEQEILTAHEPINQTFKFICQPCHTEYDSNTQLVDTGVPADGEVETQEFAKIGRIRLWGNRPDQANHKIIRAYLELETYGDVTLEMFRNYCSEEYGIDNFNAHFASMKTDNGNSHGKVFYERDDIVKLWDIVRVEIEEHFPQT